MKYDPKYYRTRRKTTKGWRSNYLYAKFDNMKQRCYNTKSVKFTNWGARGIKVEAYLLNFKNFVDHLIDILPEGKTVEDMQKEKWSIDRINNDAGYVRGNLRWASEQQQQRNKRRYKNNASGFKGVHWDKKTKKWVSKISVNSVIFLGYYNTKEEAFIAYLEAVKKYFGEEAYQYILSLHPHWEAA